MAQQCCSSPGPSAGLALVSSLLCSSCCLIQLVFNAFSLGCAGFASLEPYKHYFRALQAGFLFHMLLTRGLNKRTAIVTAASVLLGASQELVAAVNQGRLALTATPLNTTSPVGTPTLIYFQVQQMKCEGCASHLRQQLIKQSGVQHVTVDFNNKQLSIQYDDAVQTPEGIASAIRQVDHSYQPVELEVLPLTQASLLGTPALDTDIN